MIEINDGTCFRCIYISYTQDMTLDFLAMKLLVLGGSEYLIIFRNVVETQQ